MIYWMQNDISRFCLTYYHNLVKEQALPWISNSQNLITSTSWIWVKVVYHVRFCCRHHIYFIDFDETCRNMGFTYNKCILVWYWGNIYCDYICHHWYNLGHTLPFTNNLWIKIAGNGKTFCTTNLALLAVVLPIRSYFRKLLLINTDFYRELYYFWSECLPRLFQSMACNKSNTIGSFY